MRLALILALLVSTYGFRTIALPKTRHHVCSVILCPGEPCPVPY